MEGDEAALQQRPLPARARVHRPTGSNTWRPAWRRRRRRRRRAPPRSPRPACRGSARRSAAASRSARAGARRRSAWRSGARAPARGRGRTTAARRRPARVSKLPDAPMRPVSQSCSKLRVNAAATRRRVERRDDVLLARQRVERPVHRAGPEPRAPSRTDVLVVHQVAPAGDRPDRHAERLQHVRLGARRRGEERPVAVVGRPLVLVERDPDPHAAGRGAADRVRHRGRRRRRAAGRRRVRGRASRARRRATPTTRSATASAVWPPSVCVRTSSTAGNRTPAARLSSPTCAVGVMAELIDICPVEELPPGAMRLVEWEDLEIGVFNCAGDAAARSRTAARTTTASSSTASSTRRTARSNAPGTGRCSTCAPESP